MNTVVAALLIQDGITNGAIYALIALALVLVFAVTRVIFVPQGEFVSYGALTLASLQAKQAPGTLWVLLALGLLTAVVELTSAMRSRRYDGLARRLSFLLGYPMAVSLLVYAVAPREAPMFVHAILTLLLLVPLGPMIYRLAYQPLAEAPGLVLFTVSVAGQLALRGLA